MRLIDADKLIEDNSFDFGVLVLLEDIEKQPTVEAIPVKWLKTFMDESRRDWSLDYHLIVSNLLQLWKMEKKHGR